MENAAATFCSGRLHAYGIFSIIIGLVANACGTHIMKYYTVTHDNIYKYMSIITFSIGVVLITYGAANIFLKNNIAMCALSMY